jgi:hypothetical protein
VVEAQDQAPVWKVALVKVGRRRRLGDHNLDVLQLLGEVRRQLVQRAGHKLLERLSGDPQYPSFANGRRAGPSTALGDIPALRTSNKTT